MSAHPIMAQALAPFMTPRKLDDAATLRRKFDALRADWGSLLRLPFEVEVETRPVSFHGPAEYATVYADEDDVQAAVDWLIDKHIDELEAKVRELMKLRAEDAE
jgi:hypothetical protein